MPRRRIPILFGSARGRPIEIGDPRRPYRRILRKPVKFALATALGLVLATVPFSLVVVDQAETAYVTEFGRLVRVIAEPGLHLKWPYQTRNALDRRLRLNAPPAREMLTRDRKSLEVGWSVSWKPGDVGRFVKGVRTPADAAARLEDVAASVFAAELAKHDLNALVKVGGGPGLDALMADVSSRVADQADKEFGLKVVGVRLRRLNYPDDLREAVFGQIRGERERQASATRAEGESQARKIRSGADLERSKILADADADAARLIGEGEAQAVRISNEANAADPAFYQFLKTLETYRAALDTKTTLVLSADSAFLRLLVQGVPESHAPVATPATPSAVSVPPTSPQPQPQPQPVKPPNVRPTSPAPVRSAPATAPVKPGGTRPESGATQPRVRP